MNMKDQEHIPDKIKASGKNLPFKVPDTYFEDLPGRIHDRLSSTRMQPRQSPLRTIRPQLAIAAMFVGMIAVGYAGFSILSNRENSSFLSNEEFAETLEYLAYDIDEDMLITAVMESGTILDTEPAEPETDELIEYLSEEKIDFSELLNNY